MKISKTKLQQIIKEEAEAIMREGWTDQVLGFFGKMSPEDQEIINDYVQGVARATTTDEYLEYNAGLMDMSTQGLSAVYPEWLQAASELSRQLTKVQQKSQVNMRNQGTRAGAKLFNKMNANLQAVISGIGQMLNAEDADNDRKFQEAARVLRTAKLRDQYSALGKRTRSAAAGIEKKQGEEYSAKSAKEGIQNTKKILYMIADRLFDEEWRHLSASERMQVYRKYENWTDTGQDSKYDPQDLEFGASRIPDSHAQQASEQRQKTGGGWASKFKRAALGNESISREKLEKIVKEEIAKLLEK